MTGFFEGISNFFARHRGHCSVHEIYQSDCEACVAANQSVYIDSGPDAIVDNGGDSFMSTDSSGAESSSCDASDFSGFGGGDSGGGGASGDF